MGFDRITPPETRIERRSAGPAHPEADPTGRSAVFTGGQQADDGDGPGRVDRAEGAAPPSTAGPRSLLSVECQHCGITAPMPLGTAVRKALPLALVNPLRSHPVFAVCPCGERRAWLRPTLGLGR